MDTCSNMYLSQHSYYILRINTYNSEIIFCKISNNYSKYLVNVWSTFYLTPGIILY